MTSRTRIRVGMPRLERRTIFTGLTLAVLLSFEVIGRRCTADGYDLAAIVAFAVIVLCNYIVWGKDAVAWAQPILRFLDRHVLGILRRESLEMGVDLRQTPPVPRGDPLVLRNLLVGAAVFGVILWAIAVSGGIEYRAIATQTLYVGHLALLTTLVCALLLVLTVSLILPAVFLRDSFAARHIGPGRRPRRNEWLCVAGYFGTVLVASLLLPIWAPVAMACLATCAMLLVLTRSFLPSVTFLWRHRGSPAVRSIEWRSYEARLVLLIAMGYLDLALLTVGRPALGLPPGVAATAMPLTEALGKIDVWLAGTTLASSCAYICYHVLSQAKRDPARPYPTSIHVAGDAVDRSRVRAAFAKRNWIIRFAPTPPEPEDVRLEIRPAEAPKDRTRGFNWPLRTSLRALNVPELHDALARRDDIQRRRALMKGLERMFKSTASRRHRGGQGFWLAPHYWYVVGLARNTNDDDEVSEGGFLTRAVGPAYHRVIPASARHHIHEVLRALEIDLIFVEDGVGFRGLRKVMRILFEHYDMHGGQQRFDEKHCRGLPGIRVVVHDYELGNPLRSKNYPEPEHDILGRARVLHIFRDRGENEEQIELPIDQRDRPVPVAI